MQGKLTNQASSGKNLIALRLHKKGDFSSSYSLPYFAGLEQRRGTGYEHLK